MHKKRELLFSNSLIFKWCHRESKRIFSPLLYQLSYGTVFGLGVQK